MIVREHGAAHGVKEAEHDRPLARDERAIGNIDCKAAHCHRFRILVVEDKAALVSFAAQDRAHGSGRGNDELAGASRERELFLVNSLIGSRGCGKPDGTGIRASRIKNRILVDIRHERHRGKRIAGIGERKRRDAVRAANRGLA